MRPTTTSTHYRFHLNNRFGPTPYFSPWWSYFCCPCFLIKLNHSRGWRMRSVEVVSRTSEERCPLEIALNSPSQYYHCYVFYPPVRGKCHSNYYCYSVQESLSDVFFIRWSPLWYENVFNCSTCP